MLVDNDSLLPTKSSATLVLLLTQLTFYTSAAGRTQICSLILRESKTVASANGHTIVRQNTDRISATVELYGLHRLYYVHYALRTNRTERHSLRHECRWGAVFAS